MTALFVAVGTSGQIDTSPDGVNWTARTSSTSPSFFAAAYGGGKWVAAGSDGPHTSTDGVTWTRSSTTPTNGWRVTHSDGVWVLLNTSFRVYTSPDAATWTDRGDLSAQSPFGVESNNGTFVAFGSGGVIFRSTDGGVTWTARTSGTTQDINGMAYGDGRWLGVTEDFDTVVYSDDDGLTWTAADPNYPSFFPDMRAVAYGGGRFVAVGLSSGGAPVHARSVDGLTWTDMAQGGFIDSEQGDPRSVAYAGVWVALDQGGNVASSPDGVTWTRRGNVGSNQDVFGVVLNAAPNAPIISDQGTFDRDSVNRVTWTFSDPDAGDSQSAAELRYREDGTSTWTLVEIGNPNQFWDSPAGTFVADLYEAQVRTADQAGVWGPWSSSFFITAGDAPAGPTWLDPINGQTIGTSSYTFVISAPDVERSEFRLVADDAGSPDESTILHGPVTKTNGVLREHEFTGLANNVPVHPQARVEFDGIWSPWVSIRTPVSYTAAPTPALAIAADPDTASIGLLITNPAPGVGEPAVTHNDLFVRAPGGDDPYRPNTAEGTRIATLVGPNAAVTDHLPASGVDYEYRVVAHGENSTVSDSGWQAS